MATKNKGIIISGGNINVKNLAVGDEARIGEQWSELPNEHTSDGHNKSNLNTVFISYNHKDQEDTLKLKSFLEDEGVKVILDQFDMQAGQGIKEFIHSSIKKAKVVISVVSNNSLQSAWVGMESLDTIFLKDYYDKEFIACYLDDDFFQDDYVLRTVDQIDDEIKKVRELIQEHHERNLDSRNLNNKLTRLNRLRNNLDQIIGNLLEKLCLDLRGENFNSSLVKILNRIS